jgi:ribosomal protein S15P/S13E
MVTTKAQVEELIFTRGVHLETEMAVTQFVSKTGLIALPASTTEDDTNSIREQLTALTAKVRNMRRHGYPAKGGRGRGIGRGSLGDSQPE